MVLFFFYNDLTDIELIKKINTNAKINDGFVMVQNYDSENDILEISEKTINNNILLYGKIVMFDMKLDDVIQKINKNPNYTLGQIWANKSFGGVYKTYIIY